MKLTKKQLTVYLVWRAMEIVLVLVLIGLVMMVSQQIQSVRRTVAAERLTLEASLRGAVRIGTLRAEIARRQHDIERIKVVIPDQNNIGNVVSVLEAEADNNKVSVTVPNIIKVMEVDEANQELPQTGPLQDIKLTVKVVGSPNNVLQFFHAVENAPYLVGVKSFKIGSEQRPVARSRRLGFDSNLPGEEEEIEIPKISMSFDLILSSLNTVIK